MHRNISDCTAYFRKKLTAGRFVRQLRGTRPREPLTTECMLLLNGKNENTTCIQPMKLPRGSPEESEI